MITACKALILFLLFDFVWISLNFPMYKDLFQTVQHSQLVVNLLYALVVYVLMVIGLCVFVLPMIRTGSFVECAKAGGLFGLTSYGIYNFTNLACFSKYKLFPAIADTGWGGVLFTLVTFVLTNKKMI